MKKVVIVIAGLIVIVLITSWISISVPSHPDVAKTKQTTGRISEVYADSSTNDISIILSDNTHLVYYINNGLGKNSDLYTSIQSLEGSTITVVYYSGGWDLFGIRNKSRHVCELKNSTAILYTEF